MNKTGIIYEIQENKAVVLTSESEFVVLKRRQDMNVGQQVRFEKTDVLNPNRQFFLNAIAVASVVAVFIVAFLYFQFFLLGNDGNIYGYIGVDINPSVEFEIEEDYRVLDIRPLNEEGKQLIRELDIQDKKIDDAVSDLLSKSIEMGFIDSDDERIVLVSGALKEGDNEGDFSASEEETRLYELLSSIKNEIANNSIEGHIILVGPEERKYALEKNVSMGKYGLFLRAEEMTEGIAFEDICDMSVAEMIDKLGKIESQETADDLSPEPALLSTPKPMTSTPHTPQKTGGEIETTPIKTFLPSSTDTNIQTTMPGISVMPSGTPVRSIGPTEKPTPTPEIISEKVAMKIQYFSKAKKEIVQGIEYSFRMFNTGNSEIDLRDVKVRYYFNEGVSISEMNSAVYFYSCGYKEDVHCKFYNLSSSKEANKYLEITFDTGSLSPDEILYITGAFYKNDWGEFDQSDDYSYNPVDTYVDWENMTVYVLDKLVWGQEP